MTLPPILIPAPDGDGTGADQEIHWIPAPRAAEETGLGLSFLEELALKVMTREREFTTRALADVLALSAPVVDEIFQRLRKAQLIEVTGLVGTMYRATLSGAGRARAEALLTTSQYVGPTPVPLGVYTERVRTQLVSAAPVQPERVRRAFDSLVLHPDAVRQIGIAIASGAPLMLFGPSGTGKTSIAERIPRVFDDGVFIPHAIEVEGRVITVFDPGVHRRMAAVPPGDHDRRWVYCERPFVVAGGELTAETLDLQYNPASGFYSAPPQLKANGGVFVIDDFGRQRMRPEELLNRWVVPLDRGTDYLTLHGGGKFAVPFAVLVVFATNLDPTRGLAPEAGVAVADAVFLRRIPHKVRVGYASPEQFHEICRRACTAAGLTYDPLVTEWLIALLEEQAGEPLRPSLPRDLVRQITWEARYEGVPPAFDATAVSRACRSYFALAETTVAPSVASSDAAARTAQRVSA